MEQAGVGHHRSPLREGLGHREIGRSVEHQPEGPVHGVLEHEHHGPVEVRVAEHRLGDQQTARGGGHAESRTGVPWRMLPMAYDVSSTPSSDPAARLEVTILGRAQGRVVSCARARIDELALGTPGRSRWPANRTSSWSSRKGAEPTPGEHHATSQRSRRVVPVPGDPVVSHARGGADDPRPIVGRGRHHARGRQGGVRPAAPPRAAVPPPSGGGALRSAPSALDRGSRLRPRLPHPCHRAAVARALPSSCRRSSAGCRPSPSIAPGRSGRCGSSRDSRTATWPCSRRCTTPPSTARPATSSPSPSST